MVTHGESVDRLHALIQMRCRQEVLERWLACQSLPDDLQHGLCSMLTEVEQQLRVLTDALPGERVDSLAEVAPMPD